MGRTTTWMAGVALAAGLALAGCQQPDAGHRNEGVVNESQKQETFTREKGELGPRVQAPQSPGEVTHRVDEASRRTNMDVGTPGLSAEPPATGAGGYTTGLEPRDGGLGVGGAGYADPALQDAQQQQPSAPAPQPPQQKQQSPQR